MAKQFLANRSGQTPTLDEVPNETIKIYPTEAALDADLANLEENEIVATDEDNNPASGTQYPVDIVQDGNMHAVTSNAVADKIAELLDWKYIIVTCAAGASGNLVIPASYDGNYEYDIYDYKYHVTRRGIHFKEDGRVDLGCIATNYAGLSNDLIRLENSGIGYTRQDAAGNYRIAYRPLPSHTAL